MKLNLLIAAFLTLTVLVTGTSAHANYALLNSKKRIECVGPDNSFVVINANRSKVKFEIEGESNGSLNVLEVKTDGQTFASFTTDDGTLTLSNQGDTWVDIGKSEDYAWDLECK